MNSSDQRALDEADVSITIVDAVAGQIIDHRCQRQRPRRSPAENTMTQFGSSSAAYISTLSYGPISVTADPWLAPIPAAAELPPRMRLVSK